MNNRVKVFERTDPVLTFRFKKEVPGSTLTVPYTLDNVTEIEFLAKNDYDDDDGDAVITRLLSNAHIVITDDGTGVSDKYSEITVALTSANLTDAKNYYYFIRATKAGKKEVINSGILEVQNI